MNSFLIKEMQRRIWLAQVDILIELEAKICDMQKNTREFFSDAGSKIFSRSMDILVDKLHAEDNYVEEYETGLAIKGLESLIDSDYVKKNEPEKHKEYEKRLTKLQEEKPEKYKDYKKRLKKLQEEK